MSSVRDGASQATMSITPRSPRIENERSGTSSHPAAVRMPTTSSCIAECPAFSKRSRSVPFQRRMMSRSARSATTTARSWPIRTPSRLPRSICATTARGTRALAPTSDWRRRDRMRIARAPRPILEPSIVPEGRPGRSTLPYHLCAGRGQGAGARVRYRARPAGTGRTIPRTDGRRGRETRPAARRQADDGRRGGPGSTMQTTEAAARRHFRSKVDSIRPTYGFDDVSLAPGTETVEPNDVSLEQDFCGIALRIPVLAAAMDAVVDARSAGILAGLGGLAVLNLEGVQARYEDPGPVLERIATARPRPFSPTRTRPRSARS